MSATARAEARRKAILNRGADRLAKLTTSARGEDAPAYLHDDPPLAPMPATGTRNFLGEESSDMPSVRSHFTPSPSPSPQPSMRQPRSVSSSSNNNNSNNNRSNHNSSNSNSNNNHNNNNNNNNSMLDELLTSTPNSSVWSPEQQQDFIQALMNASSSSGSNSGAVPQLPLGEGAQVDPAMPTMPMDNPFAALMAAQLGGAGSGGATGGGMFSPFGQAMGGKMPGMSMGMEPSQPKSKLQKMLPLLHLVAMWCLLAYFVLWVEPSVHAEMTGEGVVWTATGLWRRWADLGQRSPLLATSLETFKVHVVPFFWAFTTLQIALHSLRIFSGFDSVQPPMLLAMVLPSLPPPLPSIIVNSLKYMQMGSLFLDDLSGLVVGIGFVIYFSGWFAQAQS